MNKIHRQVTLPYSALQMYALVNDVNAYPEFLPWCEKTRILRQNGNELDASITLKKGAIRKTFATRNLNTPGKQIEVGLLNGPFRSLAGHWYFHDLPDGSSIVRLEMEFEFASRFLDMAIGPVFREIVRNLVSSFQRRAIHIYGQEGKQTDAPRAEEDNKDSHDHD